MNVCILFIHNCIYVLYTILYKRDGIYVVGLDRFARVDLFVGHYCTDGGGWGGTARARDPSLGGVPLTTTVKPKSAEKVCTD
jgi:hypothetical protein